MHAAGIYHYWGSHLQQFAHRGQLMQAADVCSFVGRHDTAREYTSRADALRSAVNHQCHEDGLYLDESSAKEFSQHSQVSAILSESITGAQPRSSCRGHWKIPASRRTGMSSAKVCMMTEIAIAFGLASSILTAYLMTKCGRRRLILFGLSFSTVLHCDGNCWVFPKFKHYTLVRLRTHLIQIQSLQSTAEYQLKEALAKISRIIGIFLDLTWWVYGLQSVPLCR